MSNQIPKSNHPWRNYANKIKDTKPTQDARLVRKPLQMFLQELVESWGRTDISIKYRGRFDRYYLLELPDYLVANWLTHILRTYNNHTREEQLDEEEILDELG